MSSKKMGPKKGKEILPDEILQEKVQQILDRDQDLRSYALKADVVKGEARLQGIVDTLIEKNRAEELVRGVPGIRSIDNAVSLSTDGPITDKNVEFEVAEELAADPRVNLRHLGAESHRGTVILKGKVVDPGEVEAARRAAAKARGVKEIISEAEVKKPEKSLAEIFHSQVKNDSD